jgi:hypothetical protein
MAESKKSNSGGSGSSRSKKSGSSRSKKSNSGSRASGERSMSKAEEARTGGKEMGRPPSDEPDVYVDVPELHVGELNIDVEQLQAHLALRAQVANLVNLIAGVQVSVDKVKIDLKDVNAKATLKVRLQNTYNILDRTLTTLDENPEIVKGLLETADTAVQETGQIGKQATRPGGAVSELSSGVGDTLGNIGGSVGDAFSSVAEKASPKRLTSGSSGGSAKTSGGGSSGSGPGKGAAVAGAAGAAGLLGGALLGWRRRNGGSGFFRRNGLHSMAKQISTMRKVNKARKTADRVLP